MGPDRSHVRACAYDLSVRQRRLYPRRPPLPEWVPELVLRVRTHEGEVEERSRVLMYTPLRVGAVVPFRDTTVALAEVEFFDGTYYAVASA